MFERDEWYPVVGFDKELFGEELVKVTRRLCGNAFRGVCDADLPPIIAKEAAVSKKTEIHLLADAQHAYSGRTGSGTGRFRVQKGRRHIPARPRLRNGRALARRICIRIELALDPSLGPADILIVGDHSPPLWSRQARAQFEPGLVAWYRLTPRDDVIAVNRSQKPTAAR
jgi:hypothetical protein